MQRTQARPRRDYRAKFAASDHPAKDLHIEIGGPNGGSHFAGVWTLDEAVELATDILAEDDRRKGVA